MKKIYRCKHEEVEVTGYDDAGPIIQCQYCGEVFTDYEYDTLLQQRELESKINNICGIHGVRIS